MKSFLKKIFGFLILPIIIIIFLIIGYFVFDPLKVLYWHDSYSHTHANRDYYTIETFNKRYPKEKYNSFIFGSSRTLAFRPSTWIKYLEDDSKPFMMDGYAENIYGIYHKIKYLDSLNIDIKNALIILDVDATLVNVEPIKGFLYTKHPLVSGKSKWGFQREQFEAYCNINLILRYYLYKFGNVKNNFVYKYIGNIRASVDSISNELRREDLEKEIKENVNFFDRPVFYPRPDSVRIVRGQIDNTRYNMLKDIADIFKKHGTNYKIIIGPDYDQKKYDEEDQDKLRTIFGNSNIFNFSGKNKFTESKYNYYENSHYRPLVGDSIMKYIYSRYN